MQLITITSKLKIRVVENEHDHFSSSPLIFTVKLDEGITATVTLKNTREDVLVHLEGMEVDQHTLNKLSVANSLQANEYDEDIEPTIRKIVSIVDSAARPVVQNLKYFLIKTGIAEDVIHAPHITEWTVDGKTSYLIPGLVSMRGKHSVIEALPTEDIAQLQKSLDEGIRPFVGLRHLYRAIQETVPEYKCIDAAIATELAIKEALILGKPDLEDLLLTLPSPPIEVLYSAIMKRYLGESSSVSKSKLSGVMQHRNRLVHRLGHSVSLDEANAQIYNAMQAIYHLYAVLYPEWSHAKNMMALVSDYMEKNC